MAERRRYWAQRHGLSGANLDLGEAVRLYLSAVDSLRQNNHLQKWFGYDCVDDGFVPGLAGTDVEAYVFRHTRRQDLWPFGTHAAGWDEAAFLTAVEFMYDHVSVPTDGRLHTWNNCGYHGSVFDDAAGQRTYRTEVNAILTDYANGFELQENGEVVRSAPVYMTDLLTNPLAPGTAEDVMGMVASAVGKFRRRNGPASDRRDAVRDLADVLELLHSRAEGALNSADEKDLFHLANKFGLRHANDDQKDNYDKDIWYDWMFYYYVSAIQAFSRVIARPPAPPSPSPRRTATLQTDRIIRFRQGMHVRHARLGEGTVLLAHLTRNDEEVTVSFAGGGTKTLLASIAALEVLPPDGGNQTPPADWL